MSLDNDRGDAVLTVADLAIDYHVGARWRTAVQGIDLRIPRGTTFGLVGESGCGKSTVALAVMGYLPRNGRIRRGGIRLGGRDLARLSRRELRQVRARNLSMVYQDPAAALNPTLTVGRQVAEVFELLGVARRHCMERVYESLERVRIADPREVAQRYPHQLSGGMAQRVVIAMAVASEPELLILDEPTTGLDATVEAEVLDLVTALCREMETSVLLVSHDLAVVRKTCQSTTVLYAGRMAARGPSREVFTAPRHPHTVGLLRALPSAGGQDRRALETIPGGLPPLGAELAGCFYAERCPIVEEVCRTTPPPAHELGNGNTSWCHFPDQAPEVPRNEPDRVTDQPVGEPLLAVRGAAVTFRQGNSRVHALAGVDLSIAEGETVALVGESGSGKSTLAKLMVGLHQPDPGTVLTLQGQALAPSMQQRTPGQLRAVQMVFQNPDGALNRRHSVGRILSRAVRKLSGKRRPEPRVRELLESVRMGEEHVSLRPRQLSGGLKQRLAIARAFAGSPRLVIVDEPTSALDVSVQAAILNLLNQLQARQRVSYLFISHDLAVVRYVAHRVAVLYLGRVLEEGPAERVFRGPHHPYTEALLSASPQADEETRIRLHGEMPKASSPPRGCVFHTRCHRKVGTICETEEPALEAVGPGHGMRCHIPVEELGSG